MPIEPTVLQSPRRSGPAAAGAKPAAKAPANATQHAASAQLQRQQAKRAAGSGNGAAAALKRLPAPARDAAKAVAAADGRQLAIPRAGAVSQTRASVPADGSAGLTTAVLR